MSMARTGPGTGSARYCAYFATRRSIATSRSALSSTTRADGFVIVGEDSEGFRAGDEVEVWLYA